MLHLAIDTIFRSTKRHLAGFEEVEFLCDRRPDRHSSPFEAGLLLNWKEDRLDHPTYHQSSLCHETVELDSMCKYAVYIYMTEIYNDKIYDLLLDTPSPGKRFPLSLKTNPFTKEVYPANVRKMYVSSAEEAIRVLNKGLKLRASHSTGYNETSSRSHAIITLEIKRVVSSMDEIFVSKMTIADLAGNERNKLSKTEGIRFQESCAINKSLMLLGQCLQMQKGEDNKKTSVNESSLFRSSKLNQLILANAFRSGTFQKSVMLVAMDPYGDLNSAAQVLRYSATAQEIPDTPKDYSSANISMMFNSSFNGSFMANHSYFGGHHNGSKPASQPASRGSPCRELVLADDTPTKPRVSSTSSSNSANSNATLNPEHELVQRRRSIYDLVIHSMEVDTPNSSKSDQAHMILSYIQDLEDQVDGYKQKCLDIEWEVREEMADEQERMVEEAMAIQLDMRERDEVDAQRLANSKIDLLRRTVYEPQIEELSYKVNELEQRSQLLEKESNDYRRQNEVLQEIIRRSGLLQHIHNRPVYRDDSLEGSKESIPLGETDYLINLLQNSGF